MSESLERMLTAEKKKPSVLLSCSFNAEVPSWEGKKNKTWRCGSVHAGRCWASQFFFPLPNNIVSFIFICCLSERLGAAASYYYHGLWDPYKKIRMDWNIVYRREEDGQRWGVEIRADLPTDYSDMLGYILHFHILITHIRPVQPGIHNWVPGPMPNHFTGCGLFFFLVLNHFALSLLLFWNPWSHLLKWSCSFCLRLMAFNLLPAVGLWCSGAWHPQRLRTFHVSL